MDKQFSIGHEYSDRLFCNLIAIFEDKILPAHRSKFVQVHMHVILNLVCGFVRDLKFK